MSRVLAATTMLSGRCRTSRAGVGKTVDDQLGDVALVLVHLRHCMGSPMQP
eukprot:m.114873 g.114873  ORF g.114873 m.114873 type:complete len:51 (-) comp21527_c0_seq3:96-248(-)